ncbi:RIP metalloprotease RseP [Candidatus Omnitrophota bacterium]
MTTILAFIFVLSILVIVHEFGHYAVAKLAGIGVERFSIGMPPRFIGIKIGETDYCISAIPFGGYVKLTGQSDISQNEEEDYGGKDYRKKPVLVRMAVLAAGSIMNLVTAVVIFFLVYWVTGVADSTNTIGFVKNDTLASQVGLRIGDEITEVNGKEITQLDEVFLALIADNSTVLTVRNDDGERMIDIPRKLEDQENFGIALYYEAKIKSVISDSPAEKAGISPGDIIIAIDNEPVFGWEHMRSIVEANPDTEKIFTISRGGKEIILPVNIDHISQDDPDGKEKIIGRVGYHLDVPVRDTGMVESLEMAYVNTKFLAVHTLGFFVKLLTGSMSVKHLGGPVMIAQLAGESAESGFSSLLGFTAFISVNLGVLNLLPFPVLDGGHIVILFIETIFRRKLPEKIQMAFQNAGALFLLLLMLYISFNDIMRTEIIGRLFGGN